MYKQRQLNFFSSRRKSDEYKSKDILDIEDDGRKVNLKRSQKMGDNGEGTVLIGEDKERLCGKSHLRRQLPEMQQCLSLFILRVTLSGLALPVTLFPKLHIWCLFHLL